MPLPIRVPKRFPDPTVSASASPADGPVPLPRALRELADALSAGVLLLDAGGVVRYVNPAEAARDAHLLGRDFFRDLAPALEGDGIGAAFRQGMADGVLNLDAEALLAGPEGTRFVRVILRAVRGRRGTWGVAMLEDRTELIAERERRKACERDAAVGRVAANLPHEVNNTAAAIRSFAQLLLRDASAPERDALRSIVAGCDRLGGLMDDLVVTLRRHGADDREPVELNELLRRVLAVRAYALDVLGVDIRLDLQEPLSPVMAERGALSQVILELLLRAEREVGARPPGGRLLVLRTREATHGVTLTVFDNGPGMSRERLLRVFEPCEGPGMGLAVAAGIIHDHGGELRVESEEARNTTVVAHLPRAGEPPLAPADVPAAAPAAVAPPPPAEAPHPLRVLVADDEPTLRLALRVFLQRRGHAVTEAEDADAAWAVAQAEPFDVALVDARMPGDGLLLLERLETLPHLRGRTALMSGDLGRTRQDPDASTARPMLAKPFELNDMATLLERLAGARLGHH